MAEYACKVGDTNGRVFLHVEVAQTEAEARQALAERGLFVYSVRPQFGVVAGVRGLRRARVVSGADFLIFNQQFNTLIKAGLPILKALDLLAERAASPRLRPIMQDIRQKVKEGSPLSEAFISSGRFSKVYTTSLLAGEKSGSLTSVLDDYIAYQKVSAGAKRRLLTVLIYPTILVLVATAVVGYLVTAVIPQFANLYKELNVPLPPLTQVLIALVVGYRGWLIGGVVAIAVTIIGLFLWSRTDRGGETLDRVKLKLPVIGETWIKFQVAQFARTLSTLLGGGTPLVPALQTSSDSITSRLISGSVAGASQKVREGESLHASLSAAGVFPELALEMIEVGEASGALVPMLTSVAQFYEDEVNLRLSALLAVVEPVILLFMAAIVAFILLALYLPIFSLSVGGPGG